MPTFYSPDGNPEVWTEKPDGYYTVDEWRELHPPVMPEVVELPEIIEPSLSDRIDSLENTILTMLLGSE